MCVCVFGGGGGEPVGFIVCSCVTHCVCLSF